MNAVIGQALAIGFDVKGTAIDQVQNETVAQYRVRLALERGRLSADCPQMLNEMAIRF